jgi:hypothetical protein
MSQSDWVPAEVPLDRPNVARMYDYFLGGAHNFAVDREAAQQLFSIFPDLPLVSQANRALLRRAVHFLVGAGINQFLDIGSGIPTAGNVHEVAQRMDPEARVAYVDVEPVAVAHSRAILRDVPNTVAVQGDARKPQDVVCDPEVRRLLDFDQPMAVLMLALLHFIPDGDVARFIVRSLRDAVPSGSYFVITHATTERIEASGRERVVELYKNASSPFHFRTRDQIEGLFEGLEMLEPGLVYIPLWRPEAEDDLFLDQPDRSNGYAGVARKP